MWMATPRSEWPSAFCIGGVSLISFGFFGILYFFLEVETFCPPPTICRPDPWPDPLVHFALLIAGGALLIAGARRPGSIPRRSLPFARGVACLIVGSGVVEFIISFYYPFFVFWQSFGDLRIYVEIPLLVGAAAILLLAGARFWWEAQAASAWGSSAKTR